MQGSFEHVYDKVVDQLKKDMYYCDVDELLDDYEIIVSNNVIFDEEFININVLSESQLINSTISEIKDNIIIFDSAEYTKKILKSYRSDQDIIKCQFDVDFIRSELIINNSKIKKISKAIKIFDNYAKYEFKLKDQKLKLNEILIMLCTQASFAFPFLLMHKIFTNPKKGIYVTSNDNKYIIKNDNNSININFKATFNLKNTLKNKIIKKINIDTNIDFVYKNNTYELCEFGIVTWKCQDIH